MREGGQRGLSSEAALARLHQSLRETVRQCREDGLCHYTWLSAAWWPGSPRSLFRVTSLVTPWVTVANVGGGAPGAKHPHGAGHQAGPHTAAATNLILNI